MEWGLRVCDFLLFRLCSDRALFQEFFAQPEVIILYLGRDLSSCRKTWELYCYIHPLRRYQNTAPRLQYCFLTALPLFLHSLPSLIRNFDSVLLESRETLGVWSLFPKNEKWVPQKAFCIHNLEGLTGCCLVSHLNFDLNI